MLSNQNKKFFFANDFKTQSQALLKFLANGKTLKDTFKIPESTIHTLYEQGYEAFLKKDFQKALQHFALLTYLSPDHPSYWKALGATHINLSQLDDALEVYQLLVEISPEDPEPLLFLAHCHQQRGESELAAKALRNSQILQNKQRS